MPKTIAKTSAKPAIVRDIDTSALRVALVADVTNGRTIVAEIRKALGLKAGQFAPAEGSKGYGEYANRLETVARDTKAVYVWENLRTAWRMPEFTDEAHGRAVGVLTKKGSDRTGAEVTAEKRARQRWNDWRAKAGLDPIDNRGGANNETGKSGKRAPRPGDATPAVARDLAAKANEPAPIVKAGSPDAPAPSAPKTADDVRDYFKATSATALQYSKKHAKHVRASDAKIIQAFHALATMHDVPLDVGSAIEALLAAIAKA